MEITVIAKQGLKVSLEHQANQYIDDQTSQSVNKTAYYMRRLKDGDLLEVTKTASVEPIVVNKKLKEQ